MTGANVDVNVDVDVDVNVNTNQKQTQQQQQQQQRSREQQILYVLEDVGTMQAKDIFYSTAQEEHLAHQRRRGQGTFGSVIEEQEAEKRYCDAVEYISGVVAQVNNTDSLWRVQGHYYLRKLVKGGRVRRLGVGKYGLCRRCLMYCVSAEETRCLRRSEY